MKIQIATLAFFTSLLFGLSSCNYNEIKDLPVSVLDKEKMSGIDFEAVNSQVFEPHCKRCHADWSGNYSLTITRLGPIESLVRSNQMPQQAPPLADEKKALLFSWITLGAPETVDNKPPGKQEPDPPTPTPQPNPPMDQIYFADVYSRVLEPKCVKCHAWLSSYESVSTGINEIRSEVASGRMPVLKRPTDTPLTEEQKTLLLNWIDSGFPESKDSEPEPLPNDLNWESLSTKIIQPYCVRCHTEITERNEWVQLVSYEDVLSNKDGVKRTVESGKMPRNSTLPEELKNLLINWIDQGLPRE